MDKSYEVACGSLRCVWWHRNDVELVLSTRQGMDTRRQCKNLHVVVESSNGLEETCQDVTYFDNHHLLPAPN